MTGLQAARAMREEGDGRSIFDRIGAFLVAHGLNPDPVHYAFAYQVVAEPEGQLARAVVAITDGGVRLSRNDIEALGGTVRLDSVPHADRGGGEIDGQAALVARARAQVDGMATIIESVEAEARGFGRDLAASAEAIREAGTSPAVAIDEIARLTGSMLQRVHESERRLANATAEARALRIQLDEARGEARSDPLTGLSNRLGLEERFATHSDTARCFAVCDIDHFKLVNDRFGHNAGDRVLRAIARTLAEGCEGHFVARLGGEEFAVLFDGADIETAARILDAARERIAEKRFRLRESDAPVGVVTLSAGLAAIPPGVSLVDACARADTALYAAKANGRDRLEIAPVDGEIY